MRKTSRVHIRRVIDGEVVDKTVWYPSAEVDNLKKMEELLPGELTDFEIVFTVNDD